MQGGFNFLTPTNFYLGHLDQYFFHLVYLGQKAENQNVLYTPSQKVVHTKLWLTK